MSESLSINQARKIILSRQQLLAPLTSQSTLASIKQLGYVQIDTISRVERAHHHTLWNRVADYQQSHIDQLQKQRQIFEYWSHAAAYLPITDYRFSLLRMQQMGQRDSLIKKIKADVLHRIASEGPLQSKDFIDQSRKKGQWWDWKPAKQALEQLFMQGELMISHRVGFQKVFDLTERVLPPHIDTRLPSQQQFAHYLVTRYLQANGLGIETEFTYLRAGMMPTIKQTVADMLEKGEICQVWVNKTSYYMATQAQEYLNFGQSDKRVIILSPFDNLVIQRKRLAKLFDYHYQLECYVKAENRKYGYFCLPILWGDELVGRMDAKAERADRRLIIYQLHIEKPISDRDAFIDQLSLSLDHYCQFNDCQQWQILKTSGVGNMTFSTRGQIDKSVIGQRNL